MDTRKTYRQGTHRVVTPDQTLARVRPLMARMGITRIANITGLDALGIPVAMVCRPASRSVAVSQGKGLTLETAKTSGLMEAVETYHAESITQALKLSSYRELAPSHRLVDPTRLPLCRDSLYGPDEPLLWIEGSRLGDRSPTWLPYEVVHTDWTLPLPSGSGCFAANTNGLASGNHYLEAVSHGICEVVERDAVALWRIANDDQADARGLDADSVDDTDCRELLRCFREADVQIALWEVTSDIRLPSFLCLAIGQDPDLADPEFGSGCHLCREVALQRALTEAAQARTTFIAGSRDDIFPREYAPKARQARLHASRALLGRHKGRRCFDEVPTWPAENIADDVHRARELLGEAGLEEVVVTDLTKPELGLPVVRVTVPGLEGAYKGPTGDYVAGRRARSYMQGRL